MSWLETLPEKIDQFVDQLDDQQDHWCYSLSSDLYGSEVQWGLGQAVFVAKILFMLDRLDQKRKDRLVKKIRSFKKSSGYFNDPLIQKKKRWSNLYKGLRCRSWSLLTDRETRLAETRQSYAALECLGDPEKNPFKAIPRSAKEITEYIDRLDWRNPWHAGSHFSHLLFFLAYGEGAQNQSDPKELVSLACRRLSNYLISDTGAWGYRQVAKDQQVNGAMKVLTGLRAAGIQEVPSPKKLIDLCLSVINDDHACGNFNIVYVLYCCQDATDYRKDEISQFCLERLEIYQQYYHPQWGGFSFYKDRCNDIYYGCKLTQPKKEPDIHGTVLFLWGISLIAQILNLPNLKLKIPIT